MDDVESGGAAGAETADIGAAAAPGRERRMTAGRKRDAVLRLLRGEPLELVARLAAASCMRGDRHSRSVAATPWGCEGGRKRPFRRTPTAWQSASRDRGGSPMASACRASAPRAGCGRRA